MSTILNAAGTCCKRCTSHSGEAWPCSITADHSGHGCIASRACNIGERCGVTTPVARLATASGIQSGVMPVRKLWPASRSRTATAVGLNLALGGPPVIAAWSGTYGPAASLSIQLPLQLVFCTLAVVVLLIVSRWEQLPLASIGLRRPDVMTVAVAVTILLLAYYVLPLLTTPLLRVLGLGGFERGLEAIANQPPLVAGVRRVDEWPRRRTAVPGIRR